MYLRFKFRVISLPPAPLKENSNTHICLSVHWDSPLAVCATFLCPPFVYHLSPLHFLCPGWLSWPLLPRRAEATEERKPEPQILMPRYLIHQHNTPLRPNAEGIRILSWVENMLKWKQRPAVRSFCYTAPSYLCAKQFTIITAVGISAC